MEQRGQPNLQNLTLPLTDSKFPLFKDHKSNPEQRPQATKTFSPQLHPVTVFFIVFSLKEPRIPQRGPDAVKFLYLVTGGKSWPQTRGKGMTRMHWGM